MWTRKRGRLHGHLSVANGNLVLLDTSRLTVTGDGSIFNPLKLIGTIGDINARLATGLRFDTFGMLGVRTISMISTIDRGNSGLGGEQTDSDTFDISVVSPFNDAPVNQLPSPFETNQTPIVLSDATGQALSILDEDAGEATDFQVTLSVDFRNFAVAFPLWAHHPGKWKKQQSDDRYRKTGRHQQCIEDWFADSTPWWIPGTRHADDVQQ